MFKKNKIGLCHGVFDVVHYGHIQHFESAKKIVDKLILSVTSDSFVNKGNDRPVFNLIQRIEFLKKIKLIDDVIISDSENAIKSLNKIKPDFYFKGIEYKNQNNIKPLNSFDLEKKFCKKNKIKIIYTMDKKYSSSALINNYFSPDNNLKSFINLVKKKYSYNDVFRILEEIKKSEINVIGDPIIDKYRYGSTIGTSSKSPSIAMLDKYQEVYKGGSIAVAEMLSSLGFKVNLIMFKNSKINNLIKINNKIKVVNCFESNNFPIIERIVDNDRNYIKMLQIYNLERIIINSKQENLIIKNIKKFKKNINSIFLVIDFGFGFLSNKVVKFLDNNIDYSVNCHLSSLNINSNYYTKYNNFNYITFNKKEFELSFRGIESFEKKVKKAKNKIKAAFAITLGKYGSIFINKNKEYSFPAVYKNIVDPVGCGDAFFAISSIVFRFTKDPILSNFLGNLYAGMHGMIVCNKEFTDDRKFMNAIKSVLS